MTDFTELRFISDDTLREMILRDIHDLDLCLQNSLYKSALILSGSIIEAILVDYFLAFPPPNAKSVDEIKKATFYELINWAADPKVSLISESTKSIGTVIREYRNLIHPGVEYRKKILVDKNKANIAGSLVKMVIIEIGENYTTKLGYTSGQAIQKINSDFNSRSLFDHIISTMSPIERIKLYKKIPLLEYSYIYEGKEYIDESKLKTFIELHAKLKTILPLEIRKAEALHLYRSISEKATGEIFNSLRFFVSDIDLIETEKRKAIIEYVLSLLLNSDLRILIDLHNHRIFSTIGKHLNTQKDFDRLERIFFQRIWDDDKVPFLEVFKSAITDIDDEFVDPFLTSLINNEYELDTQNDEFDTNIGIWAKEVIDERSIPF